MEHTHRSYDRDHPTIAIVVDILRGERAITRDDVARLLPGIEAHYGVLTCCERVAIIDRFPADSGEQR